jgi:hypothetical protein
LGFGDDDEATPVPDNNQITTYFRHRFVVDDPSDYATLSLWILRDDAGVVHLNNMEVARVGNLPAPPTPILYSTEAASPTAENAVDQRTINASFLVPGTNIAAVEIHQESPTSSDVSFNFELVGNPAPPPPPPQRVYTGQFDGQTILGWGDGTFLLEHANAVTGSWSLVGSGSPYTIVPSQTQRFYRLRKQ